jgi:photosystem II stability/assembly factor-like uncharacterized protein
MRSHSILVLIFLSSFLLLAASPLSAAWHFLPTGTPSFTFVSDSSAQRIFLSSYYTGLWRTTNGGQSWHQLDDELSPYAWSFDIRSMRLVDPRGDSLHVSSTAGVLTTDGGATWLTWPPRPWNFPFQVSPVYRDTWFYLMGGLPGGRLYRSTDRGQTWPDPFMVTTDDAGAHSESILYLDPFRDSTLYSTFAGLLGEVMMGTMGVYRSDDLGATWSPILTYYTETDHFRVTALSNDSLLVLVNDESYVNRTVTMLSTNAGATWDTVSQWLQYGVIRTVIEDRFHPSHLIMATDFPLRLLRSDDFGATWNATGTGLPTRLESSQCLSQDFYSGMLTLQADGLYTSRDFGENWTAVPMPPIGNSYSRYSITPEAVFLGESELQAPYERWRTLNLPSSYADTSVFSSPVIYKHGDTLAAMTISTDERGHGPSFDFNRMAYSYDDGETWSLGPRLEHHTDWDCVWSVQVANRTRLVAHRGFASIYIPDTLFLSDDVGAIWRTSYVAATAHITDYVVSGSDAYLAALNVVHSGDDGLTWQPLGRIIATRLLFAGSSLLATGSGSLYLWQDSTWVRRNSILIDQVVSINTQPPFLVSCSESTDTLLVSADTGLTWQARYFDLPTPQRLPGLNNLAYDPYRQRLWANTAAGSVYLELSELAAGDHPLHFHSADYSVLSVYPNPFNSEARITYDLESRGRVQLDLYNLEGRLVRTLSDEIQESGRHELHFSGAGLSSGIYFARLITPIHTRTQKIVLLK